jgi:hypothetical protein
MHIYDRKLLAVFYIWLTLKFKFWLYNLKNYDRQGHRKGRSCAKKQRKTFYDNISASKLDRTSKQFYFFPTKHADIYPHCINFLCTIKIQFLSSLHQLMYAIFYFSLVFKLFLISNWAHHLNTSPILINVLILLFLFIIILLTSLQVNSIKKGSLQLKVLFVMMKAF